MRYDDLVMIVGILVIMTTYWLVMLGYIFLQTILKKEVYNFFYRLKNNSFVYAYSLFMIALYGLIILGLSAGYVGRWILE